MTRGRDVRAAEPQTAGQRSETVRQSNLAAILTSLHLDGPASRSELGIRTGLSRGAIGALVQELVMRDLVAEARAESGGSPGRPSPVASVRARRNTVLAVEVLVDSIAVAAVGLGGTVLSIRRLERPRERTAITNAVDAIARLADAVIATLDPHVTVHGIGVAIAGIVRRGDDTLVFAPNLGWEDEPLGDLVTTAVGLDVPVSIGNDGNLGALGESRRGAARGLADIVYLSGEVGVGSGIISGNRLVTGPDGFAGEAGHMPVNVDGVRCNCGAIGCWETEAGEDALLRRAGRDPDDGPHAVDAIVAAAGAGDADAIAVLEEHGRWLGIGIAGLVNLVNPRMVVLGGLLQRIHPFTIEAIERELGTRAIAAARSTVRVVPSALAENASLLGAAELAWMSLLTDPGSVAARSR